MTSEDLVVARSVVHAYRGRRILDGADITIGPDVQAALTGRSGSGKTTLLLILAGLLAPTAGDVAWPAWHAEAPLTRGRIGMIFQAPSLMPELTALQNVNLPQRLRGVDAATATASSMDAMAAVAVADLADALPAQMSGGQQQRVAVARVLAGGHQLVLADEPTGALDRAHAHEVVTAVRGELAARGGSLIVATHDLDVAGLFAHRFELADGLLTARSAS